MKTKTPWLCRLGFHIYSGCEFVRAKVTRPTYKPTMGYLRAHIVVRKCGRCGHVRGSDRWDYRPATVWIREDSPKYNKKPGTS
jgi:hypothetical protein